MNIEHLPSDVLFQIFCDLSYRTLLTSLSVSKKWKELASNDRIWIVFCKREKVVPTEQDVLQAFTRQVKPRVFWKILEFYAQIKDASLYTG
jgi:hypothetical protein